MNNKLEGYEKLSKKSRDYLENGYINISRELIEKELDLLDKVRPISTAKEYFDYDPIAIYGGLKFDLTLKHSELKEDSKELERLVDKEYPIMLLRTMLIGIKIMKEEEYRVKGCLEYLDNEDISYCAEDLLNGIPVCLYKNIAHLINEEEYEDIEFGGISFKKAYEINFPNIKELKENRDDDEGNFYNRYALKLLFTSISYLIENNESLEKMYRKKLERNFYIK